jgi:hypothetical protein
MRKVWPTVVETFGSRQRACAYAAADSSRSPQYRHIDEAGERLRIVGKRAQAIQQAHHGMLGEAAFGFEVRGEIVCQREIRIVIGLGLISIPPNSRAGTADLRR